MLENLSEPAAAPERVRQRLRPFDLTVADLELVLGRGEAAAASATPAHPVMAAGILRWLETVASLRTVLAGRGWTFDDNRNSPRVLSPDGRLAIVVSSGDRVTGVVGPGLRQPRTVRPRGDATRRAVLVNAQLALELPGLPDLSAQPASRETWVLLYHRSRPVDPEDVPVIRAELSLPVSMSSTGYVDTWVSGCRIVAPDVPVRSRVAVADAGWDGPDGLEEADDEAGADIDFDVSPL